MIDPRLFAQQNRIVVGTITDVRGPAVHGPAFQYFYSVQVRLDTGTLDIETARPFNPRPIVDVVPYQKGQLVLGVLVGDSPDGYGIAFLFWEQVWYDPQDCETGVVP